MPANQYVRERCQPHEQVIANNLSRMITIEEWPFFVVYIKRQTTEMISLERVNNCGGVDKTTAGGVDKHCSLLHFGQRRTVDDLLGVLQERTVQTDDIALCEYRVKICECAILLERLVSNGIVRNKLTSKAMHYFGKCNADSPGSYETDCLAV